MTTRATRYLFAKKVTLLGALINVLLGISKLVGGLWFHSHALFADGLHSFSDLLTDAMVLFASKYGNQDADAMHPYGHQRIETTATLLLALVLVLTGVGIGWDAAHHLLYSAPVVPGVFSLPIVVLSIVANEALFYYMRRVGQRIESSLLLANAWHHRSDAWASGIVLLGLLGSFVGFYWLDAVAALVIGALIIKMGLHYGWSSIKELIDTGVDAETRDHIEQLIRHTEGVEKIHQLRTRMMGQDIYVDVHVLVDSFISVSEGHHIAQKVHVKLMKTVKAIKDVTVHVDPEDDEVASPSFHLPSRKQLEKNLLHALREDFPEIQTWQLHYLDGNLVVDVILNDVAAPSQALEQRLQQVLSEHPHLISIRLLSHLTIITRANITEK